MIPKRRILFADNDPDLLEIRSEFLKDAGYEVIQANSPNDARKLIADLHFHMAILDIRLLNDNNDFDTSGVDIAKELYELSIPTLILTGFPRSDDIRNTLRPQKDGRPISYDFIYKTEPMDVFIEAVDRIFNERIHINLELNIDWQIDPLTLVYWIVGADEQQVRWVAEIDDLFRKLFYDYNYLRVRRQLWQDGDRQALVVYAFRDHMLPEAFLVLAGPRKKIENEVNLFNKFAPIATAIRRAVFTLQACTPHFAAATYILSNANLENIRTLLEYYHSSTEKEFIESLADLYMALLAWQHEGRQIEYDRTLSDLYQDRLGISQFQEEVFEQRMDTIINLSKTIGASIERKEESLVVSIGQQVFVYPDPLRILRQKDVRTEPIICVISPGNIETSTILTDTEGHTWITDFASAGSVPLLWNYTILEAEIRFDLASSKEFQNLFDLEYCASSPDFNKLDFRDLNPHLRRPMKAIETIRKLAIKTIGKDLLAYHQGVMFHAIKRIYDYDPMIPLMPQELARLAHIIISIAMIGNLIEIQQVRLDKAPELLIDLNNRCVLLGSKSVPISGNSFDLLTFLYNNAGNLCTREDIVHSIYDEQYNSNDQSQMDKLNIAIRRLREKLESDPSSPRYLVTGSGGYILHKKPQ